MLQWFMIRFTIIIVTAFLVNLALFSNDDLVVSKMADILIEEYQKYEDKTFMEKFVLKLGKNAYIDSVTIWKNNYKNIDNLDIKLHRQLENSAKIADKRLPADSAEYYRNLLRRLTYLGYMNLQMYFNAVKDKGLTAEEISIETIDDSVSNAQFYNEKVKLYNEENEIKNKIREFYDLKEIKYHISFYAFAFNFFDKIRKGIIEKDMKKMNEKLGRVE